jgi:hypothetical protein
VKFRAEFNHNGRTDDVRHLQFGGFREVGETDGLLLLEHDLRGIQPFPDYVDVRDRGLTSSCCFGARSGTRPNCRLCFPPGVALYQQGFA